jgi:hypothetical protein
MRDELPQALHLVGVGGFGIAFGPQLEDRLDI